MVALPFAEQASSIIAPPPIERLLQHRVILILGKGGVGRSTAANAIGLLAARRGKRTLLIETDSQRPIAASYGHQPGLEPVSLEPHLWSLFLGGQESLEDYLGLVVPSPILRAVFASSLYQYFVDAAPAMRELTMMGKIYHEIERRPKNKPPWELIVVDAPASGQALAMVRMPFVARETFGSGIVGSEAAQVAQFFRDSAKCAIVIVTTAEALAVSETLEIYHALEGLHLTTSAVCFNRVATSTFDSNDLRRMAARLARDGRLGHVAEIMAIARADLRRRTHQERALGIIQRQIQVPIVRLHEHLDSSGQTLGLALAAELAGLESRSFPAI